MSDKLPEWPKDPQYIGPTNEEDLWKEMIYERARAEAAIARLKVAVTALNHIAAVYDWNDARDALAAIGPIEQGE